MSDVGDVNNAHLLDEPEDYLDLYLRAAARVLSQNCSTADRMAFLLMHKPGNVVALGNRIEALRAENRALMETLYGKLDGSPEE